jgi:PAS domain S-box-containing protein
LGAPIRIDTLDGVCAELTERAEPEALLRTALEEQAALRKEVLALQAELGASRQKVRALDEELRMVIEQLHDSNAEVSHANAQLRGRLAELETHNSVHVATLFLDEQLRIVRFTPGASELFPLLSADVGRPVVELTPKFRDDRFAADLDAVLAHGEALQADVPRDDGRWYLRQTKRLRSAEGVAAGVAVTFRDITERKRAEEALQERGAWLRGQRLAIEAAVNGAPLATSLGMLVSTTTASLGAGVRAAFYLADERGAALHLVVGMSDAYAAAVNGFKIGPDSLACGLATYTAQPVLIADVQRDPRWKAWRSMAERFDYRGCWSFPIHSSAGRFAGTFAVYWRQPHAPSERELEFTSLIVHTAAIIVAQHREAEVRQRAEQKLHDREERSSRSGGGQRRGSQGQSTTDARRRPLRPHRHRALHVRMHGAVVGERSRGREMAREALSGQQQVARRRAVGERDRVRCAVVVAPRHRRPRSDDERCRREREVRDRDRTVRCGGAACGSGLHDDLARCVADRDRPRAAARQVDDGEVVRAFAGHPRRLAVASHPVRLLADRDGAQRLVARRVEQEQLARALDDDRAERCAARLAHVRRRAGRDVGDDAVRRRIDDAQRVDAGTREVEQAPLVAELGVARRLLERDPAHDGARREVDDDEREVARLLRRHDRDLAIGADRDRVRFRDRDDAADAAARGVDEGDAVAAVDADQHCLAIRHHRDAVRRRADVDRACDAVARGVDHRDVGRAFAGDPDEAAVGAYRHAVRAGGDRHRLDDGVRSGVDHAHRRILEVADVRLRRRRGGGERERAAGEGERPGEAAGGRCGHRHGGLRKLANDVARGAVGGACPFLPYRAAWFDIPGISWRPARSDELEP